MAFEIKNLSVLAYANGFTLWHYTTPDAAATVDNTGYFNAAGDMLQHEAGLAEIVRDHPGQPLVVLDQQNAFQGAYLVGGPRRLFISAAILARCSGVST